MFDILVDVSVECGLSLLMIIGAFYGLDACKKTFIGKFLSIICYICLIPAWMGLFKINSIAFYVAGGLISLYVCIMIYDIIKEKI